jgi:predicted AAA+ superfamily ATPase
LHKHTSTKATPKAGNFKTYLVDLAVRNAVLKISKDAMADDPALLGTYAENIVAKHLRQLPGLVELGFWRQGDAELDFIVDLGDRMIGVEVKYRGRIDKEDIVQAAKLAKQLKCASCVVVSKDVFTNEELVASVAAQVGIPVAVIALPTFLIQ